MPDQIVRCPYLYGLNLEGDGYYHYPSTGNCCSRRKPETTGFLFFRRELPPLVEVAWQESHCLSGTFEECSLYRPPESQVDES
jgi:hypothetical protein